MVQRSGVLSRSEHGKEEKTNSSRTCIQLHHGQRVFRCELIPRAPLGEQRVDADAHHHVGKALVEEKRVPPRHGGQIAKPLVRHLVGDLKDE